MNDIQSFFYEIFRYRAYYIECFIKLNNLAVKYIVLLNIWFVYFAPVILVNFYLILYKRYKVKNFILFLNLMFLLYIISTHVIDFNNHGTHIYISLMIIQTIYLVYFVYKLNEN